MLNKILLIGRVGSDPESKYLNSGSLAVSLRLATTESWKTKTGEKEEQTQWHNIQFYGKLAEVVNEFVKKGVLLYIEGAMKYSKIEKEGGVTSYFANVNANVMKILTSKNGSVQSIGHSKNNPDGRFIGAENSRIDPEDDIPF